ncbi:MAG TPA: hypothetical protein ENH59_11215 [Bacteroidetes bacterium]|nr:hypothetical protein [Bacteroidota bacterium]
MHRSILLMFLISLTIKSCLPPCEDYATATMPVTPVNMEDFNSEYDDYNPNTLTLGTFMPLCFSSNRNSEGINFDIIYEPMSISWDKISGDIIVMINYDDWPEYQQEFSVLRNALDKINTDGNELGPYYMLNPTPNNYFYQFLFMYASNEGGDYQIGFTYNTGTPIFKESMEINFLNSEYDELYPCFNMDLSKIYFCSNRDNDVFNIYAASLEKTIDQITEEFMYTETLEINMDETLSGDYNDKCPYIYGNIMVFASDRPGGEGGFDLYYSEYNQGVWGPPVNFGQYINSPDDEYRPLIINEGIDFDRDMLIFSSDRPGGKGGFDLYYVGIEI